MAYWLKMKGENQMLKFIQIGTGGMGSYWCNHVLPYVVNELNIAQPVAAVDINPDVLHYAVKGLGLPQNKCYVDVRKAFEENKADFVIIVVPPAFHKQMVDLALEYDCHILSEKPIADTMEACCRIYHKVMKAGKKMAITMSHRFDQDKQTLEALIKSGDYGSLNYIVCSLTYECRKYPTWGEFRYKMADPLLIEGAVHHFDILRALTGSNAKTIYAMTWNPAWSEFKGDSTAFVMVEMENGVHAFYEGAKANATSLNGWGNEYIRAECDKATLILSKREIRVQSQLGFPYPESMKVALKNQKVWMNKWLAEMFIRWMMGGEKPENNLEDNIQCAAMLFAAIESSRKGQPVDVQQFLRRHMEEVQNKESGGCE
jgi:predicted dehydrogenase